MECTKGQQSLCEKFWLILHSTVCWSGSWTEDQAIERSCHLIILSSHCLTSPPLSMSGSVDSPDSHLPVTLQVNIISCHVTLPYAHQGMHWSWKIPSSSTVKGIPSLWEHYWRALCHLHWSLKLPKRTFSWMMRRDLVVIKRLFRNVSFLALPNLCGSQWRWNSRPLAAGWQRCVSVGEKVVSLWEERQLLACFLIIQQSCPDLVPCLPATTGDYEMVVTTKSMFASAGSLLIPTDKASIIHAVEKSKLIHVETQTLLQISTQASVHDGLFDIHITNSVQPCDHVIIIDSMAVVQCMKKTPGRKKILDFKKAFVNRIARMVKSYDEAHILFDRYDVAQSWKQKTRTKRAQGKGMELAIHDEMDIAKVILKELISASKTKALLSNTLGDAVLEAYQEKGCGCKRYQSAGQSSPLFGRVNDHS